ncbi:hypothetical protein [Yinghuangia seranimata]|uniref:hypothetical protein n=1 Tax=Yinghuangia seranimata TaxID=408067 RepID=UPI00248CDC4A|nr:hypothetical protein [Yinghuangia seranimata]MDI2129182.1 hypothetical protein [Yinghuangia seranimata]
MTRDTATHDERIQVLEAEAFRTGRTLAEYSQQLKTISEAQITGFRNIDSLADAIGAPGDRSIAERLDTVERVMTERLDAVDGRLNGLDGRLDDVNGRLDGLDGRLDGLDGRLNGLDGRLDGVERLLFALARAQGIDPDDLAG